MDIEQLINDWRNSVDEYSKAKADTEYLREFRKSKKAILIGQAEKEGHKTGQERESYAYSHKEYVELLDALRIAIEKSEQLRWRMTIAQERINIWRTKQANGRKEQSNYGA
tara:strand:+ start:26518 stop:26850 length:333 start_codon:yes stop_codon:yes gene_type:complete